MRSSPGLPSIEEQNSKFTNKSLLFAYKILWLEEDVPSFTTRNATFLPFALDAPAYSMVENATWTAETIMYSSTLECKPAKIASSNLEAFYDNGKGCRSSAYAMPNGPVESLEALYIGYWTSPYNDYYLSGEDCAGVENERVSLAIWARNVFGQSTLTGLFCEPSFWSQNVNLTVYRDNLTVEI